MSDESSLDELERENNELRETIKNTEQLLREAIADAAKFATENQMFRDQAHDAQRRSNEAFVELRELRAKLAEAIHPIELKDVEEERDEALAKLARAESFDGILDLLRQRYPSDVFDGSSGDAGAMVAVLTQKLSRAKEEIAQLGKCNDAFGAENRALRKNLEQAAWNDWKGEMAAVAPTTARIMRDWYPVPELAWHNVGVSNWRATWNNIPIAGYCDEPSEHRDGVYVMWGNTIFTSRIATAEEARAAINAKFREWLTLAASVFLGGGGAERQGDDASTRSRAASPSGADELRGKSPE